MLSIRALDGLPLTVALDGLPLALDGLPLALEGLPLALDGLALALIGRRGTPISFTELTASRVVADAGLAPPVFCLRLTFALAGRPALTPAIDNGALPLTCAVVGLARSFASCGIHVFR